MRCSVKYHQRLWEIDGITGFGSRLALKSNRKCAHSQSPSWLVVKDREKGSGRVTGTGSAWKLNQTERTATERGEAATLNKGEQVLVFHLYFLQLLGVLAIVSPVRKMWNIIRSIWEGAMNCWLGGWVHSCSQTFKMFCSACGWGSHSLLQQDYSNTQSHCQTKLGTGYLKLTQEKSWCPTRHHWSH